MKILHVISTLNPAYGGPSEGVRQLTRAARGHGAEPAVVTLDPPDSPWLKIPGLTVYGIGRGTGTYAFAPQLITWLKANVHRYDVVIVNGLWQFHLAAAWWVLRKSNIPYLVYPHGMLDPWFKEEYPLKHIKKTLYWWLVQHAALSRSAGVLFTCEEERRLASKSFWPYDVKEYVVNYGTSMPTYDIDTPDNAFLEQYPYLRGTRIWLYLGRIHEKKGCDLLIEAFSKAVANYPDVHLVMAGPDHTGLKPKLEKVAAEHGVAQRILWPGMLQGETKWAAFAASELFVLPSHQENFGIAVAEALAIGTPVLISNKVNIWREIEDDQAGIITRNTIDSVYDGMLKWLALTHQQRLQYRQRARTCFSNRFNIDGASARMLSVAREVSGANTASSTA